MKNRFEELFQAADDGASSPPSPWAVRSEAEFDQILDAWFLERRNSIEFEMLLHQSRRIIARLLSEGANSAGGRKRARSLLRAIDQSFRAAETESG